MRKVFRRRTKPKAPQFKARPDKTIVLVGMMGVGKTTVGRRLARALGLPFLDCDQEIEKAAGMSVSEIFELFGEKEFRSGERRVIARLLDGEPKVLATGGGAFVNEETRALIKKTSYSVWLDADISVLVERTGKRNTRPILEGVDRRAVLERLMKQRRHIYAEADFYVKSSVGPHQQVVEAIVRTLSKNIGNDLSEPH